MNEFVVPRRGALCALSAVALAALAACSSAPPTAKPSDAMQKVNHVVVIYAENHSFDNMYGLFPGANGISRATPEQATQVDHDGTPLPELLVFGRDGKPDPAYPRLPNRPFRIDAPPVNRPANAMVPSPTHLFYHNIEQINGGRNNRFAAMSAVGGWTMGHYDGSGLRMWQWAREYTLADNFFQGAFGGSYLNHQYLVCACAPVHEQAPDNMRIRLDSDGRLQKKPGSPSARVGAVQVVSGHVIDQVTPDGRSVNTSQPSYQPSGVPPAADGPRELADPKGWVRNGTALGEPLPPQTARTVGDTLSAKGVSWAWFAGGYRAALADGMQERTAPRHVIYHAAAGSPNFQPHHQPFNYYSRFAPGTADRARHLQDGDDFLRAIDAGTLPQVSFYKPAGVDTQHPSYTTVARGDAHIADVMERLRRSPQWKDMLVVVTYDENGGYWDHVPPPTGPGWGDRWGPGSRIPAILAGPMVRRGFIDSTAYDTGSILKFLTERFKLEPLPGVRANIGNLTQALQ